MWEEMPPLILVFGGPMKLKSQADMYNLFCGTTQIETEMSTHLKNFNQKYFSKIHYTHHGRNQEHQQTRQK